MSEAAAKEIEVIESVLQLAELMLESPSMVDQDLLKAGRKVVSIFQDPKFSKSPQFIHLKKETLKIAVEDVASGGDILMNSVVGLQQENAVVQSFILPVGTPLSKDTIFAVFLENLEQLKADQGGLSELQIQSGIYYLAHELSQSLR